MFLRNVGWLSIDYMAAISQKIELYTSTTVRTSNPTRRCFRIWHYEGPRKPGGIETGYGASGLCWYYFTG
jgi:hypothetical protein